MLASVCRGQEFVLLADAYYANGKVIRSTKGRPVCWSRGFDARQPAFGLRQCHANANADDRKSMALR